MKFFSKKLFLATSLFFGLANGRVLASASNVYIAQGAVGLGDGSSCVSARAMDFFNNAGNWGAGSTQIGPGTTVHLCGTITTELQVQASGASGNVIEVLWESGAKVSLSVGSPISLNGQSYLLFDGGSPCGPSTVCSSTDIGTGIVENIGNGSSLAHQNSGVAAFDGTNGSGNLEFRNLIIRNLYVHTSSSDTTSNIDTGTYGYLCTSCTGTISMHDSTLHDLGTGFRIETPNGATLNFYNNNLYNDNWGLENSGNGKRTVSIHDNHFGTTTNWDTTVDAFHHNGLHNYQNVASDSVQTMFYNNLSDGDWGSCCTTATVYYQEDAGPNNWYVFNNVAIQYPGNRAPAFLGGAVPVLYANNTAIGVASTPSNTEAMLVAGTISVENNAIEGYGQHISVYGPGLTTAVMDYNQYGAAGLSGNSPWQYGSTAPNTFAAWKTACSCDSHGGNPAHLGVSASGVPQFGSPLIGAGVNLTGLGIAALNFDTSAGGTRTPMARPASGAWDVGAYQYSSSAGAAPGLNPPTLVIAVGH